MADKGWIKLDRAVRDLPFWDNAEKLRAYIDLLFMANYKDSKATPRGGNNVITIHEGEIYTSIESLMARWNWSKNRVVGFIKMLEQLNLGHAKGYAYGTIITLENIDDEATNGTANGPANRPANGSTHGPSHGTPHGPANGPAHGPRLKKDKKDKNNKNQRNQEGAPAPDVGFVWGELE